MRTAKLLCETMSASTSIWRQKVPMSTPESAEVPPSPAAPDGDASAEAPRRPDFGNLPVAEPVRDGRNVRKFFNSAEWAVHPEAEPKPPVTPAVFETLETEVENSPLQSETAEVADPK
jgi:hypothetical protein